MSELSRFGFSFQPPRMGPRSNADKDDDYDARLFEDGEIEVEASPALDGLTPIEQEDKK